MALDQDPAGFQQVAGLGAVQADGLNRALDALEPEV